MLLVEAVTEVSPPPVIGPITGDTATPVGAAGTVPAVIAESVAGLASVDETTVDELPWTTAADTLAPVTMASTVSAGRAVPLTKADALVVQVMARPTGAAHTHPVPKAPTGTTPVGTVWVTEIGLVTSAPASTLAAT
jgi:hypothetical protein